MVKSWKSKLLLITMTFGLSTAAYADNHAKQENEATKDNPVVLSVNGKEVTKNELMILQQSLMDPWPQYDFQGILPSLQDLATTMILGEQYAAAQGIDKTEEFNNRLNIARTEILRGLALEGYIQENLTDEHVLKLYNEQISQAQPQEERKIRHILVENEEEAYTVIEELKTGGDFSKLAQKYSIGPSGDNGGQLGWATQSDFVPEFSTSAWEIPVGEYSKKPVKSNFGYHIIIIDEARMREPAKFEDVKDLLKVELAQILEVEFATMLEQNATIERFAADGSKLPEELKTSEFEEFEDGEGESEEGDEAEISLEEDENEDETAQ